MKIFTKILLSAFAAMALSTSLNAQEPQKAPAATYQKQDTVQIVEDTTTNGVRHIKAVPCKIVCSALIDFDIIDGKIHNLVYKKGCDGNLQAIGRLLEGMTVSEAIARLDGVDCHGRGTSCTDQLAQVLKAL